MPDKWIIEFKPDMQLHKDPNSDRFVTTFPTVIVGQIIT